VDTSADAARKRGPGRPGAPVEPPPFKWKLVGDSAGVSVTLIKSVERAEVEAQLERLREEGYYRNLSIVPIEEPAPVPVKIEKPVEPPTPKPPAPKKSAKKAAPAAKAGGKTAKKASAKRKK
jgi:hypothetical protein